MKKLYTVLIFGISMLLVGNLATAQLLNLWIDGDRVVYELEYLGEDGEYKGDKYFYPHLSYFFGKTYEQQDAMISALEHAKIDNWRWAYYADMMAMRISMFGFLNPDAFNMTTGINTNRFFMYTDEMHVPLPGYVTHGRTGDELGDPEKGGSGAKISAQINAVMFQAENFAPRYKTYGTRVYPDDPNFANLYYTLPRGDYDDPYFSKGSEAQDHWFELFSGGHMFNDDLNYTAEDVPYAWQDSREPKEDYYHPCGAFSVYDGPEVAEIGELNIRPWSDHNQVDPDSEWYLPVAILSTEGFKANWIDFNSIRIGPDPGGKAYKRRRHLKDVDKDGDKDLILYFKISETGIWPGDNVWGFYAETHQGKGYIFMDNIETTTWDGLKSTPVDEKDFPFTAEVYPNPFSHETNIRFHLPEAGHVMLKVYNMLGQEILILANNPYEAGTHTLQWDGTDMYGNEAPGGIYIYRIQVGDKVLTDRIQLIR